MLIVCPSCASEYSIDPAQIGAEGRKVRCAACRTIWRVVPEPTPELPPAGAPDAGLDPFMTAETGLAEAVDDGPPSVSMEAEHARAAFGGETPTPSARPRRRSRAVAPRRASEGGRRRTAVAAALGVALVIGLIVGRTHVVRAMPDTAALYAALRLPVNLRGLEFRNVRSQLATGGSAPLLAIEGAIVNVTGEDIPVPPLAFTIRNDNGQALYTWRDEPPRATLAPGETVSFRARLASPPSDGRDVLVRFVPPDQPLDLPQQGSLAPRTGA